MDPALQCCVEKEKEKCLKQLQSYYQKYGCEEIEVLRTYLKEFAEKDPEIKAQLALLDDYS